MQIDADMTADAMRLWNKVGFFFVWSVGDLVHVGESCVFQALTQILLIGEDRSGSWRCIRYMCITSCFPNPFSKN